MHDRGQLEEAISTYNRYRSPMAEASLEGVDELGFTARKYGPFCRVCCDYD